MKIFNLSSSLATKWLIFQIVGFSLILCAVGFYQYRNIRESAYNEIRNSGDSVSQAFKEILAENPELFTAKTLQPVLLRLVNKIPNVKDVCVIDRSGLVIVDSDNDNKQIGEPIDQKIVNELLQNNSNISYIHESNEGKFLRLIHTIQGRYDPIRKNNIVGLMVMDIDLKYTEKHIIETFLRTMMLLSGLLLLFWIVQYILARRGFLDGLKKMTSTANRFGKGDFSARVSLNSKDELGLLAGSFNRMAAEVEQSETRLKAEIEERTQAQAAVKLNENRMSEAQRIAHLGSWEFDIVKNKIACTDELYRIFGIEADEYDKTFEGYFKYIHPDDLELVKNSVKQAICEKNFLDYNHRVLRKDGAVRVIHSKGVVIVDETGATIKMTGTVQDITERTEVETALRESEEKNRSLIENANDIIYSIDLSGRFTSLNQAGERILGYTKAEVYEMTIGDVVSPADAVRLAQRIAKNITGAEMPDYELEIIAKDGGKIMLGISSSLIVRDGKPIGIQGIGRDITERKKAEIQLRNSEEFNRSIFENSPDCVKVLELDGTLHLMNANGLCIMEIDDFAPFVGQVWTDFWQGEERQVARRAVEDARNGKSAHFEGFCRTAKGTLKYWDVSVAPIFDAEGKPSRLISTSRDITERKRADRQLEESQQLLQLVMDTIPQAIWWKDRNSVFLGGNEFVAKFTGLDSPKKMIGLTDYDMPWKKEESDFFRECDRRVIESGVAELGIIEPQLQADGRKAWLRTNKAPLRNADGDIIGVLGTFEDITEQKRAEAERQVISEIAQSVITTSNLEELYKLAHASINKLLPAENFFIALHNSLTDLIYFEYWVDIVDPIPAPRQIGKGFTSHILRTGQPLLLSEEIRNQMFESGEVEQSGTDSYSWMGVPLRTPSRTIGVLAVQDHERVNAYSQRDLELLSSIGNQLALAIERKQTEIELQERESKLVEAQSIAHIGNWERHIADNKVTWSDELFRILGLQPQEFSATFETFLDCVHPDDRKRVANEIANALSTLEYPIIDFRVVQPDGSIRSCVSTGKIILDEKGNPVKMRGVVQDITERKQMKDRQSAILDALPAHICLLDKAGKILEVNHEWEQFALGNGYAGGDFGIGNNYIETCEKATGPCTEGAKEAANICRAILAGESSHLEMEYPCHSPDEKRWFKLSVTPLHKEKLAGAVVMHVNITERKQIEAELEQARDSALESTRLKSEFLANMSHEIRTPMNGILGMTELTLDTNLNSEQRENLEMVRQSGESLLVVINDILDFSKIEANKIEIESINFDLSETVNHCLKPLALRAFQKKLEFKSEIAPDLVGEFEGDPNRLRQVMVNLVGNAVKFTESGVIGIKVDKESETADEVVLHFQVRDTGIGVPAEKQVAIFEAFSQADGTTTRKYGGTGLGLAITAQLVELMGGRVWVQSPAQTIPDTDNPGSIFHFTTRLKRKTNSTAKDSQSESSNIMHINANSPGLRILLAEDNFINQHLAVSLLKKLNHVVKLAVNGKDAVAAFEREAFDLVLMDVQMPVMGGFEATQTILDYEKSAGKKHTPIVAMTAHAMKGDRERCLDAGMDDYIAKPIRADELFEIIDRLTSLSIINEINHETLEKAGGKIDLSTLLESTGGDRELALELIEIFLMDSTSKMSEIQQAITVGDGRALSAAAHGYISSIGYFPKSRATEILRNLEKLGKNDQLVQSVESYKDLSREVEKIIYSLKEFINEKELAL